MLSLIKKILIWWICMQMSYTRGTDSCKGLEEAPPSSFQTTRSLSVLLRLQSVLLSPSIGQFIKQAF